jgi:hypothetical protein
MRADIVGRHFISGLDSSTLTATLFAPPHNIMKSFKDFKSSLGTALFGAKLVLTGQLWPTIERFESVDPAHIGIAPNVPLCRNCALALIEPQDIGGYAEIAHSFARVKASADLGCYLCSILCNGMWTRLASLDTYLPFTQKLSDIDPPPDLYSCRLDIADDDGGEERILFQVGASAARSGDLTKVWQLKGVILMPEEGES